jgi:hypothetical protein
MRDFAFAEPTDEPAAERREIRSVELAYEDSSETAPEADAVIPSARPALLPPEAALFRLGAGYGAIGRLELAPCREQGLPAGYLHVRVTFRDDGRVVRAAVEGPVAPPPQALACIGEQLKLATVPIFAGGDVTLSKSFFVN